MVCIYHVCSPWVSMTEQAPYQPLPVIEQISGLFSDKCRMWWGLSLCEENFHVLKHENLVLLFGFGIVMHIFNKQVVSVPALSWSNCMALWRGQMCYRYLFHLKWSNSPNWQTASSLWCNMSYSPVSERLVCGVDLFAECRWVVEELLSSASDPLHVFWRVKMWNIMFSPVLQAWLIETGDYQVQIDHVTSAVSEGNALAFTIWPSWGQFWGWTSSWWRDWNAALLLYVPSSGHFLKRKVCQHVAQGLIWYLKVQAEVLQSLGGVYLGGCMSPFPLSRGRCQGGPGAFALAQVASSPCVQGLTFLCRYFSLVLCFPLGK